MLRLAFVLSLVLLNSDLASSRQTWEKQPEYAEVNPGESVVLQCIINNKEGDCRYCDIIRLCHCNTVSLCHYDTMAQCYSDTFKCPGWTVTV